jgi:hypothetical protein
MAGTSGWCSSHLRGLVQRALSAQSGMHVLVAGTGPYPATNWAMAACARSIFSWRVRVSVTSYTHPVSMTASGGPVDRWYTHHPRMWPWRGGQVRYRRREHCFGGAAVRARACGSWIARRSRGVCSGCLCRSGQLRMRPSGLEPFDQIPPAGLAPHSQGAGAIATPQIHPCRVVYHVIASLACHAGAECAVLLLSSTIASPLPSRLLVPLALSRTL